MTRHFTSRGAPVSLGHLDRAALEAVLADPAAESLRDPAARAAFVARCTAPATPAFPHPAAWALWVDLAPVAAFGAVPHWPGRAEGWMVFARTATRQARVLTARAAADRMDWLQTDPFWRRIEMYVHADQPWAVPFGRALGMHIEARVEAWAPDGADFFLMARIAKGAAHG